jgi:hypothetical protein
VYKLSIAAACGLQWPKDRIMVQVLDDSTDPFIKVTCRAPCFMAGDYSYRALRLVEKLLILVLLDPIRTSETSNWFVIADECSNSTCCGINTRRMM